MSAMSAFCHLQKPVSSTIYAAFSAWHRTRDVRSMSAAPHVRRCLRHAEKRTNPHRSWSIWQSEWMVCGHRGHREPQEKYWKFFCIASAPLHDSQQPSKALTHLRAFDEPLLVYHPALMFAQGIPGAARIEMLSVVLRIEST